MRNKIDNILIGMVWLLSATLATFFWFNIRFGFDLFSSVKPVNSCIKFGFSFKKEFYFYS